MGQGSIVAKDRKAAQEMIDNPRNVHQPLHGKKLLALFDLSDKLGLGLPEMVMRYVACFPEIHTHIAGARLADHLKANIAAVQAGPLPADVAAKIEAIGRGEI
jgi:aryl-alcohol dehydrogenase-like predicted oxidoreductase